MNSNQISGMDRNTKQSVGDGRIPVDRKKKADVRAVTAEIAAQIAEDILFLRDHIEKIKQFNKPNKATLETYENMLSSREAVLLLLEENNAFGASKMSIDKVS